MIVIADTTPANYLVLIQQADLLPRLFGQVLIPPAVFDELKDPETPALVRTWLAKAPSWLQVKPLHSQPDPELDYLDEGEREAITLADVLRRSGADSIPFGRGHSTEETMTITLDIRVTLHHNSRSQTLHRLGKK